MDAYRAEKARRKCGKVSKLLDQGAHDNFSMFTAKFCEGAVKCDLLADQGSDVSILLPQFFDQMRKVEPDLTALDLQAPKSYRMVDDYAEPLTCRRKVTATVMLNILHGTKLSLHRLKWMISDKPIPNAIICRHVLTTLGLDNRVLLAAASEHFNGEVEIPSFAASNSSQPDGNAGTIQSLLREQDYGFCSTFHSQGESIDDLDDSEIYIDLGEDDANGLNDALAECVQQAADNGMYESGCKKFNGLLQAYKSVFE